MTVIIDGSGGVTFPNSTVQASAGQVLQVVQSTFSAGATSASSTFADTGVTASITPKFSTSKILVIVQLNGCGKQSSDTYMRAILLRGATRIQDIESLGAYTGSTATNWIGSISSTYLDSPATTSSTTYKVQFSSANNTGTVYISGSSGGILPVSTITLMEIAG
jgi:hypothetical protein